MEIFIHNVSSIRKKYGLTQKEMAKIMHISISSLSRLEKGMIPKKMMLEAVFCLSDYFNIPCHRLVGERMFDALAKAVTDAGYKVISVE